MMNERSENKYLLKIVMNFHGGGNQHVQSQNVMRAIKAPAASAAWTMIAAPQNSSNMIEPGKCESGAPHEIPIEDHVA